ncbi:MAG: hypothetical protein WCP26_14805 [Actinomycetes bacterium]
MTTLPLPRLLMVLGSGETSPTMVTPHQRVFSRLGAPGEVPALLLDTPFGFQENADELTDRVQTYFRESVGRTVGVASLRSRAAMQADPAAAARALAALGQARWVFAGPGSPSYALEQWSGTPVVGLLDERLRTGGAVVFASAAALTLGAFTIPVYEVYKVGQEPRWLEGLDVLGRATGLRAAIVPHFDNAEGGTHDTRFCYMGERRLASLIDQLPDDAFVLGIDEHTGVVIDVASGEIEIVGRGRVTVRTHSSSTEFRPGDALTVTRIAEIAGSGERVVSVAVASDVVDETSIAASLAAGDVEAAVTGLLMLQADPEADSRTVGALIAALGERAANAPVDRESIVGPYVELLLEMRMAARAEKRFADSDLIRDRLAEQGVTIRDTPTGPEWDLA